MAWPASIRRPVGLPDIGAAKAHDGQLAGKCDPTTPGPSHVATDTWTIGEGPDGLIAHDRRGRLPPIGVDVPNVPGPWSTRRPAVRHE